MGFVDAATAAGVRATKEIAAAGTVERKAVAQSDVVLAQDLQAAWGAYAAAERSAVTLNARERATIGSDYKKEVAGAELAAVKAVAPGRKDSMVAAAEANGDYHVRVTRIVADLGILGGEIKLEATKAKASSVTSWLGSAAQGLWDAATSVVSVLRVMYDVISLGAHTALSVGGMVPLVGGLFDLADLALTAVELPFGKSDNSDLALATLSIATTAAPGPVDAAAGGAKIGTRIGKIGGKIADGIAAARKGLDELGSAGRSFVAPNTGIIRGGNKSRVVFDGMEVRGVRELSHVSDSTLKQMAKDGFAAKDINGKSLQLHHVDQNPAGPVVEIPGVRHKISNSIQHPLGNAPGAGLTAEQRAAFDAWRVDYWKARAAEELARRGITP